MSTVVAAACLVGPWSPAAAEPGGCEPGFEVVDHRGAQNRKDENTVPAIVVGSRRGDSVEIDVRATSDGRLILMHDKTFDRTTNGSGLVAETTFEQARTYRTEPDGEIIPTLGKALRAARPFDVDVYLDVKDKADAVLLTVADTVRRKAMTDRVLVTSWNGKMRQLAPDIARQWKPDGEAPTVAEVVSRDVQSIGLHQRQMSQELVTGLRETGVEVHSRLVSTPEAWDAVTAYPIEGALTNRPNRLTAYCSGERAA